MRKGLQAPTTAIPKDAGKLIGEPSCDTTVAETIAIRKFLRFMLDDIQFQLGQVAQDRKVRPHAFKEAKYTAEILATYLLNTLEELEQRLSTVAMPEDKTDA